MNAPRSLRHFARLTVALALPFLSGCVIYDEGYYGTYDGYDPPPVHVHPAPVVVRHYYSGYYGPRYYSRGRVHGPYRYGPRYGHRHVPPPRYHRHYRHYRHHHHHHH